MTRLDYTAAMIMHELFRDIENCDIEVAFVMLATD